MRTIKKKIPGICGCVGAQPHMVVESRKPAHPVKIGPPLIPAEVQSYRRRPGRAGDFSLNSGGLEKTATRGARDPAGVRPTPAQPSQRQASPCPAWAPPTRAPPPTARPASPMSLFGCHSSERKWPSAPGQQLKDGSRRAAAAGRRREAGLPLLRVYVRQEAEAQRGREGCRTARWALFAGL